MVHYSDANIFMLLWLGSTMACLFLTLLLVNGWNSVKARKRPMAVYVKPDPRCERSVYHRTDWWRIQRTQREVK